VKIKNSYLLNKLPISAKQEIFDDSHNLKGDKVQYPFGVNVIGYAKAAMGLGTACKSICEALKENKIPFVVINLDLHGRCFETNHLYSEFESGQPKYSVNLIVINPDQLPAFYFSGGSHFLQDRINIANWSWELEDFPSKWIKCANFFDEVWVSSNFEKKALSKAIDKKVRVLPFPIVVETRNKSSKTLDRKYLEIPLDDYLFLTIFDVNSVMERKNPYAAIESFLKAFSDKADDRANRDGARKDLRNAILIVKVSNEKLDVKSVGQLRKFVAKYPNIIIYDKNLSNEEYWAFMSHIDVYISLHRAEGFGFCIAEFMALGKPVIVTNYSGSVDFTNEDMACLVGYKLMKIKHNLGPYKKGQVWADPNIDEASKYMKKLFLDPDFSNKIKKNASRYIANHLNPKVVGEKIKDYLDDM